MRREISFYNEHNNRPYNTRPIIIIMSVPAQVTTIYVYE